MELLTKGKIVKNVHFVQTATNDVYLAVWHLDESHVSDEVNIL